MRNTILVCGMAEKGLLCDSALLQCLHVLKYYDKVVILNDKNSKEIFSVLF